MLSLDTVELSFSPEDVSGYVACLLVLATFAMRSMRRLRAVAILSNIAFIYYAATLGLLPILLLHVMLLPLNLWRLLELGKGTRQARQGDLARPLFGGPGRRREDERAHRLAGGVSQAARDLNLATSRPSL